MNAPHDFEEARKKADTYHNVLNAKFDELLSDSLKSVYVQKRSRVKSSASLAKKLEDRRSRSSMYTFDNVTDMVGFRFVCHFQNDVEVVVGALLDRIFTGVDSDMRYLREAKMYASTSPHHKVARDNLQKIFERHLNSAQSRHPGIKLEIEEKDSRYTSVHLVVERFDKQKFEVQVRNVFEDAWAEIEHALKYKSKGPLTVSLSQHLQVLNSFAQACSEYSERILADAVREGPGGSPQVRDLDARADMQGMPPAAIAAYELAAGLVAKELFTDAVAALTAFIDKHAALLADPAVRYFIFMERALVYLKLKETRLALKDYELLQAENADRALIYWRMGDARRIDGDFADAARFFELVADKSTARPTRLKKSVIWQTGRTRCPMLIGGWVECKRRWR